MGAMKKASLFLMLLLVVNAIMLTSENLVKAETPIIYVDDSNITGPWNGTLEQPYKNISAALTQASNGYTIYVFNGTYEENIIVNKTVYLIGESKYSTIIDGRRLGTGISISANGVSVSGFTIRNSGTYPLCGILVDNSAENIITNNIITSNSEGVRLFRANNNMIVDNIFVDNGDSISLYSSSNNQISANVIRQSKNNGIFLYSSGNNQILRNAILNGQIAGISLPDSRHNLIHGNTISENAVGISLLLFSTNNTFYHNNFDNADEVSLLDDLPNVWDYGGEGNYWSDYSGQDLNNDGIGDAHYIIDSNNRDRYPLMGMYHEFDLVLEKKKHLVSIISNSTVSDLEFEIGGETGNKIIRFNVSGIITGSSGFSRVMIPVELMEGPYIVLLDSREIVPSLLDISNEVNAYLYFTYTNNYTVSVISSKTLLLYYELLAKYLEITGYLSGLNSTYYDLLGNYSSLSEILAALNMSYQKHLSEYSEQAQNIRNLIYIFASTTAVLLIATVYLSKNVYEGKTYKNKKVEER